MSQDRGVITISEVPAPAWGRTSHHATLTCPHGRNTWTVFGEPSERLERARQMAPAHRSLLGCGCEPAAVAAI